MRSLVRTMLQRFGCKRIDEAATTAKALEALALSPPDLLICDRDVGPVDALEFVRDARARMAASGVHLPIILLLARTDQAAVMEAKASGADHMLAKPVSAQTLMQRISACFGPQRQAPVRLAAGAR